MRIVIDARELRTSSGRYVERLLHYLQLLDSEHEFIVLLKEKDFDGWKPVNHRFRKVSTRYKEFTFGEQLGFWLQIANLKPDLVHFAFVQQPVLYRGPVVTTMHDLTTIHFRNPSKNRLVFGLKRKVYKWVTKRVAHKSAAVLAPSEYVKDVVAKYAHINSRKITVTYEAADQLPDNSSAVANLENSQFIMYIGRPMPHKNLGRLIDAFAQLKAMHPDLKLVLAGKKDALYKMHEKYVQDNTIEGIIFTDFVSDGQLHWLYENAQAYIFPSLSEGFGLPGLEAMVHGCPLISSNATCLPEIYGDAAYYFDPNDTVDMTKAIRKVLTNENLRTELVQKGYSQAKKYSWTKTAQQTLAIYEEVLSK